LAAGIGGVAALAGAEFLMATGVGAIIVAPVLLAVSGLLFIIDQLLPSYFQSSNLLSS